MFTFRRTDCSSNWYHEMKLEVWNTLPHDSDSAGFPEILAIRIVSYQPEPRRKGVFC